eukprot:3321543-Prymnesium_polylepis.1
MDAESHRVRLEIALLLVLRVDAALDTYLLDVFGLITRHQGTQREGHLPLPRIGGEPQAEPND